MTKGRTRRRSGAATERLQSAMEYLMTYGWAILVIAIVLGVMYALGVFNGINTVPRAQPGACTVFRPNGPGSNYDVNLQGECQGQLPEFVAQFNGASAVTINSLGGISAITGNSGAVTLTGWAYSYSLTGAKWVISYNNNDPYLALGYDAACPNPDVLSILYLPSLDNDYCLPPPITTGAWIFYALTYSGSGGTEVTYQGAGGTLYSNAGLGGPYPLGSNTIPAAPPVDIGGPAETWSGYIADVQIYNTTLTTAEITALYKEGIAGVPVKPQNLVGWYPLNGNANDYSGNNNNGQASNVHYVSNWTSSYTGPGAP